MSRIAAGLALACAVVLASEPASARPGFRFSAPKLKPSAAAAKPVATTAPAATAQRSGSSVFIVTNRPMAAAPPGPAPVAPQRAVDEPASSGPFAAASEKPPAPPAEKPQAAANDCAAGKDAVPVKEVSAVKDALAPSEPPKAEPARTRVASGALVPVGKPRRTAPPAVCYVQRDGSCVPF